MQKADLVQLISEATRKIEEKLNPSALLFQGSRIMGFEKSNSDLDAIALLESKENLAWSESLLLSGVEVNVQVESTHLFEQYLNQRFSRERGIFITSWPLVVKGHDYLLAVSEKVFRESIRDFLKDFEMISGYAPAAYQLIIPAQAISSYHLINEMIIKPRLTCRVRRLMSRGLFEETIRQLSQDYAEHIPRKSETLIAFKEKDSYAYLGERKRAFSNIMKARVKAITDYLRTSLKSDLLMIHRVGKKNNTLEAGAIKKITDKSKSLLYYSLLCAEYVPNLIILSDVKKFRLEPDTKRAYYQGLNVYDLLKGSAPLEKMRLFRDRLREELLA